MADIFPFPNDTTLSTTYAWRAPASAYVHVETGMPFGALALPLAESGQHGIPDRLFLDALARVTVPPSVTIGCDFQVPKAGDNPSILGCLFAAFGQRNLERAPDLDHPAFQGLRSELQLVPLLPIIDLPATPDYWVCERHFTQLLWRLTLPGNAVAGLPPQETWPHPPRAALPFALPQVAGPVRAAQIAHFFGALPDVGEQLAATLGLAGAPETSGVPAELANEAAGNLLGIRVDLRIGSLISDHDVKEVVAYAAGDVGDGSQYDRLYEFMDILVPQVALRPTHLSRRLAGSAWSCAVDAALNGPSAWTRTAEGEFLYADDLPGLRRLSTADCVAS